MAKRDVNVRLVREGQGAPLFLLHCLGVDHRFWDFVTPLVSEFTLFRYDLPGHGETPVPVGAYTIADLSDQLAAIMRSQHIEHAHVGGISLGGLIAQDFAARYPSMVDRLVLVDTTPRYTDEMRAMWAHRAATARALGVRAMVDALLDLWFSADAVANDIAGVRYVRNTLNAADGEGYALACEALAAADLREQVAEIQSPTLVVCGANDIPSFIDSARWLAQNIRDAELVWISGARHASVLEKQEAGLSAIQKFLGVGAR